MRGSPLVRAAVTLLILLGLAPLLWQMTRPPAPIAQPEPAAPETAKTAVHLELAFTTPPAKIAVLYLGQEVWSKTAPAAAEECDLSLAWPTQGGELLFKIDWPAGTQLNALRVRLADPSQNEIERSAWGRGPVETVLGFP